MSKHHLQVALELAAEAAREGQLGGKSFRVRGGCMTPLLEDGDEVTLAETSATLLPGQIVLARVRAELLCHRLLAIVGEVYLLAGDQDLRLDAVPRLDVLGRVASIRSERFAGTLLVLRPEATAFERGLYAWHLRNCRGRRYLNRLLEVPCRRLLARQALRLWQQAQV